MGFERITPPAHPPQGRPGAPPPPQYRRETADGMVIEYDVEVPLRDGVITYADVYRPEHEQHALPAIIGFSPYGKHERGQLQLARFPNYAGVREEWWSEHVRFEGPDPVYWCAHGYAIVSPDARGSWYSQGDATYIGEEEGRDYADLIEWCGTQEWSNGKVGLSGPSYLTTSQWFAAAERPPHLAAINPTEGWADAYREFFHHGGIPETGFSRWFSEKIRVGLAQAEDMNAMREAHPFFDEYWETKAPKLERIEVPALIGASLAAHGMHLRGPIEAFKRISSEQKWLDLHGRRPQSRYRDPQNMVHQRAFFDHFLKGIENEVPDWPPVLLEVQERAYVGEFRAENEWPLARTQYRKLFLDPHETTLTREQPVEAGSVRYDAVAGQAQFDYRFEERAELIGHMKLRIWVEAEGADDMDLFVSIEKLDALGKQVDFLFWVAYFTGPVALGWLRVSHRELDPERSTDYQPVLLHRREQRLSPGEIVPVDVEIWPSSTIFFPGESLRVVVAGYDLRDYEVKHKELRNAGTHVIHAGGQYDSHLLVPEISYEPRPSVNAEGAPERIPTFDARLKS